MGVRERKVFVITTSNNARNTVASTEKAAYRPQDQATAIWQVR